MDICLVCEADFTDVILISGDEIFHLPMSTLAMYLIYDIDVTLVPNVDFNDTINILRM